MTDLFDMANELEAVIADSLHGDDQAAIDTTLDVIRSLRTMANLMVDLRSVLNHHLPNPELPDPLDVIRRGAEHCVADPDFEDRVLGSLGWASGNDSVVVATLTEMVRTLTESSTT